MNRLQYLVVTTLFLFSCGADDNGSVQPEPEPDTGLIKNSSFEALGSVDNFSSWQTEYDDSSELVQNSGYFSNKSLLHKSSSLYKVYSYQEIPNLPNGIYKLTVWVKNSGGQNACYINAKNYGGIERMTSLPVSQNDWTQVIIRGIEVTEGALTIGLYSEALPNNWCAVDNWELVKDGIEYNFLKGGDLSELSYIESKGGLFYENGQQKDCFEILKNNGVNLARLRLYNDPGNPNFTPSNRLPAGFQNPEDILSLAARAKVAGMQILLTFHYSDYWTNGGTQNKPHEWEGLSYDDLKTAVYNFTLDFMTQMKNQGTSPEFVSLGNETAGGFLFPDGGYENFNKMADLFNEGYNAVKEVSTNTKVIIHLDDAGNRDKYDWFFGELSAAGGKFDIIGASYYPFWTDRTVEQIKEWANYQSFSLGKDILIMETGYNWNPTLPSGWAGQLSDNGPYENIYPSSREGQKNFLYECFNGLKNVDNGRVIGDVYWDPVMIEVHGVGWELDAPNVVSNTTLFDFQGNVLPAFKAFKYNN
ncbi:glycoside hydrolase family 53 protein [Aegicerativicinus sediminis]|uniref:glycoside hydrolase family 53 protein n=1 Tax=Aegicerativicinus sediminis TaxID=2893202 RepID=UPI001E4E255B|nr:glycosyl hydrolase 53 family protein [Aegicerativicinus sediminis]